MDISHLISGTSAFSKSSLYIWKFSVHVLLKPSLENFEHYFANMWNECNCVIVWTFFGISLIWSWNENWSFSVVRVFQTCWHIAGTLRVSSCRNWTSSAGIPSPPLSLFLVILPRANWLHTLGNLTLSEWSHHSVMWVMKNFFGQFFSVFLQSLLNLFNFC